MKAVIFTVAADKQFRKLGVIESRRLRAKIEAYAVGESADVTPLKGFPGEFRMRVGDWRIVFEETATEIIITRVGHRRHVYD